MKTSIKELRAETKKIFSAIKQGKIVDVYYHKKCIAKIIPVKEKQPTFEDVGFGMWNDNSDITNVLQYTRKLRKGRKHDL